MRHPARARSTIGARLARVWRNWLELGGRSPGGATALPPSAGTMVTGGGVGGLGGVGGGPAAQPSGARGGGRAWGTPVAGSLTSACSKKRVRAPFQSSGTPGAVVLGEPTSAGGRRGAGLGRHTNSRGPSGAIVAVTSAASVLPASNPWPIQTRGRSVDPSAAGATISNGSLGRALHAVVSVRQRSTSAVAARNARTGNGSCARRARGRLSSGRISGARSLAHVAASESAPGAR